MITEMEFLKRVTKIGGKAYVAGGWVRDRLMERCSRDKDYVVCGLDENCFTSEFSDAQKIGNSFPVFLVCIDGEPCHVAMARTDKKKGTGYKGFEVEYGPGVTIEEDLFRRDTTINSMAWSPSDDELIDPCGGQSDIKNKIIRATSDCFCEDPVRALRTARQAAEFDFTIEDHTLEMMSSCLVELIQEPRERIFYELERAMHSKRPSVFFSMLADTCLLDAVIPPLAEIWKRNSYECEKDFDQAMQLLDKTAELSERPEVRFASLARSICHLLEVKAGRGVKREREDLLEEINETLRLPVIWRRCAEFASLILPDPEKGKDPAVIVNVLSKLQTHPIGLDGCIAVVKAEGNIESYPFLINSEQYLDAMKKARQQEIPRELKGSEIGRWIRDEQIKEVAGGMPRKSAERTIRRETAAKVSRVKQ